MSGGRAGGILLLAALLGGGCGGESAASSSGGDRPGTRIVDLDGLREAVAARSGAPLLVNFWATW